jgi:hypothetical protein
MKEVFGCPLKNCQLTFSTQSLNLENDSSGLASTFNITVFL